MPNHANLNPAYFLNRLALENMADPYTLNPYDTIQSFFEFNPPHEAVDLFRNACQAALTNDYSWKHGSAGNLVFFYERLEILVEACYLLNLKQASLVPKNSGQQAAERSSIFSNEELINPFLTIQYFFDAYSLPEWKQMMHYFMEAGISKYSVVENIDPRHLLIYYDWMERLIVAARRV